MAKILDIQRTLRQQLESLESLEGINVNIDSLLKSIKSETNKYITKNQRNINKLLEVESKLQKLLNQKQSSIGSLQDSITELFTVLSDLNKFANKLTQINKKIANTNEVLKRIDSTPISDFDSSAVLDYFSALNKHFSLSKMNRLTKYLNNIDADALNIVTDDLKKFDLSPINSFLSTINSVFGESKLNTLVKRISKSSSADDFEIVMLYLKDMDVFLRNSITYLNKMTGRIKNFVNKTSIESGTPSPLDNGTQTASKNNGMYDVLFATAGIALLAEQFPKLSRIVGSITVIGKALKTSGTHVLRGMKDIAMGTKEFFGKGAKAGQAFMTVGRGFIGVVGGMASAIAVIVAIMVMGIKRLLQGIEEAQRMRLTAARETNLNEMAFMSTSAARNVSPSGILARFSGASEENMIRARSAMLGRMGGNEAIGSLTNSQAQGMAVLSELLNVSVDRMATLYDIMENIQGLNPEVELIKVINEQGVLANRIVNDMAENTEAFVLFGMRSFSNLSELTNKLSVNMKSAVNLIEKFSTVSSAIDTSFGIALTTGNFINPLSQFMQYAFGSPDEIFASVMDTVGDISNMNRIQKRYLARTLDMTVDELQVATERYRMIQDMGQKAYEEQFSTLDDIVKSYGFQRLLGGISQILDMLEKEVLRGYFQKALEWIKSNGEKLPETIQKIASYIRDKILPTLLDVFIAISDGMLGILNFFGAVSNSDYNNISRNLHDINNKMQSTISVDDAYISNGNVIKTNPRDTAIFANSSEGLLSAALQAMGNSNQSSVSYEQAQTKSRDVKVINIKSDVKLDGLKVGEGLTELALQFE